MSFILTEDFRILTVTTNPSLDVLIKLDPAAHKRQYEMAGGKGINVSRALACFKTPSLMTGFLGGKTGSKIKHMLMQEGLCHRFIPIKKETRTNFFFYYQEKLAHKIENKGPVVSASERNSFLKQWELLLRRVSVVVISGRPAQGLLDSFYFDLVHEANKKNIFTVLDSHGKAFRLGIKAKPKLIKPNDEEAQEFLGYSLDTTRKIIKGLRDFYALGVANTIISLGEKGAAAFDGKDMYLAEKNRFVGKYPTGSGDTMVGGFVYGLCQKFSFKETFKIAVAASIANAFAIAPGEFKQSAFKNILKSVRIKKLN